MVKPNRALFASVRSLLESRRAPLLLAAIAVTLALPTLRHGLQADDNVFLTLVSDGHRPWYLFYFSPAAIASGIEHGAFPWWTNPQLTFEFLRPLASVMHWFEFTRFPELPALMRAISILLYAATVACASLAYREVLPAAPAALAGLLFAIDDGHAVTAAWVSARNTQLAALFSMLALLLHLRGRRAKTGWRRTLLALASAGSTALALAGAEAGVWALAYVFAVALALEPGSLRERARGLWPHLLVAAGWLSIFLTHQYGLRGSGWYRSLSQPLDVLAQGVLDLPLWLAGVFGPGNIDVAASTSLATARWIALPIAVLFVACLLPLLRSSRECRFFALATLGCIAPMFTTVPQDRLLVGASFGAFGLIGSFLAYTAQPAQPTWTRWSRRLHLGAHACLAPLLFPIAASNPQLMQNTNRALTSAAPRDRDVVLIDSPAETLGYYAYHTLQARGDAPRSLHQLYAGRSDLTFERIDERTLDVQAALGWGSTPYESFFAAPRALPQLGAERRAGDMHMRVLEVTADGRPMRVRFEFPDALEAPHRVWLSWDGRGPAPWTPPPLGQRAFVPGQSVMSALTL
ncbi:MAG TPA: hypothetical protein VJR89_23385 [Polyangiales bacterium]|nr:hypothetical protein [Polyangiales bacterium]